MASLVMLAGAAGDVNGDVSGADGEGDAGDAPGNGGAGVCRR